MAYDAEKAHEYYLKYRKKGLKKGRKKGRKKKSSKQKLVNLVGISNSGLNDAGKMQWAMMKESLKSEMNAEMAKAKTPEEKEQIRQNYQNKALEQIQSLKSDPNYAKPKSERSRKKSSKSGSSKSSEEKSKETKKQEAIEKFTQIAEEQISKVIDRIKAMSPEEKSDAKGKLTDAIKEIEQIQTNLKKTKETIRSIYG